MIQPVPFEIRVPEATLRDLRRRIRKTRWPADPPDGLLVSSSITTSLRDYFDNRWSPSELNAADRIAVPTAFCLFPHQTAAEPVPPRSWLDRLYNIEGWTVAPRSGHFAPVEDPKWLAPEIRTHFGATGMAAR